MVVLTEPDPDVSDLRYIRSGTLGPGSAHPARPALPRGPQGLPLVKPPYSRMTAIDLKTGDHVWMVPTGIGATAIREHPALAGVTLPPLGGLGGVGGPANAADQKFTLRHRLGTASVPSCSEIT